MKKKFEDPKIEVMIFKAEDILTISGEIDDSTGGGIGGNNETGGRN